MFVCKKSIVSNANIIFQCGFSKYVFSRGIHPIISWIFIQLVLRMHYDMSSTILYANKLRSSGRQKFFIPLERVNNTNAPTFFFSFQLLYIYEFIYKRIESIDNFYVVTITIIYFIFISIIKSLFKNSMNAVKICHRK